MDTNYEGIYTKYGFFYDSKGNYDDRNNYVDSMEGNELGEEYKGKVENEMAWGLEAGLEEKSQYQLKLEYEKEYEWEYKHYFEQEDKYDNKHHCHWENEDYKKNQCEHNEESEHKCEEKQHCEYKEDHEHKCEDKHHCEYKEEHEGKCEDKNHCECKEEHEDKCEDKHTCECEEENEHECEDKHHCECERGDKGKRGKRGKRGHKGKKGKLGPNVGKNNALVYCSNPLIAKCGMSLVFNKSLINGKYIEFKDGSDYILLKAGATYFVRYTFTAYPVNSCNAIRASLQLNGFNVEGGSALSTGTNKCDRVSQSVSAGTIITIDKKSECNKLTLVSQKNAKIVGGNFTSIQIVRLY